MLCEHLFSIYYIIFRCITQTLEQFKKVKPCQTNPTSQSLDQGMGLVEFSFMMMLQKVKSVSGRACSLEHLEVFEGENALQVNLQR